MDAGSSLFFYSAHARWCNMIDILANPHYLEYHCFHQPEPVSTSMALIKMLRLWDSLYSLARAVLRTKIWVPKAQIAVDPVVCELLPMSVGSWLGQMTDPWVKLKLTNTVLHLVHIADSEVNYGHWTGMDLCKPLHSAAPHLISIFSTFIQILPLATYFFQLLAHLMLQFHLWWLFSF